jgi:outer membrane protein assembly factor BamB
MAATHVYLYTLDPTSGVLLSRQHIGDYREKVSLTAPLSTEAAVIFGVHADSDGGTQQVLALTGDSHTWNHTYQFPASLVHGTVSLTSSGNFIVQSDSRLQVMTPGGQLLWQRQAEQPTRGTHHFLPISDDTTIYTVYSVERAQLIAYDQQDGTVRWAQTLDDTLDYMPPLLLDGHTLYVASDHNIYALNSTTGSLFWKQKRAARTLLMEDEGQIRLLLAAGEQGLAALDPATGALKWLFHGQASSLVTAPQLYQAILASSLDGNVVYTTGVAWQLPQAQQQIWLYAIDASSGMLRWSQQVTAGFTATDAGRTFSPLFDSTHNIVVLQEQLDDSTQSILAFNASDGALRWKTLITDVENTAPSLLHIPSGPLVLLATSTNNFGLLPSLLRVLMMVSIIVSLLGLLLLSIPLLGARMPHMCALSYSLQQHRHNLLKHSHPLPLSSRRLVLLFTLAIIVVVASTGSVERQYTTTRTVLLDVHGSVISRNLPNNLHQLQALDQAGNEVWRTFVSEGAFSLPAISTHPGTLLAVLSNSPYTYRYAPDDPAYAHQLDHLLTLVLLDRRTGKTLWQHIVVYPEEQRSAVVLAADKNFIYVASIQTSPSATNTAVQLLAVNQTTGSIDWRVFGSPEPSHVHDYGALLLLKDGRAIWQVAGTLYAIDTALGQIE